MSNTSSGGTMTVRPILRIDANQCHESGMWTVVGETEIVSWSLSVGSEVRFMDYDEGETFYYDGSITEMKPCGPHAPGHWVITVNGQYHFPDA